MDNVLELIDACLPGETVRTLDVLGEGDFCRAYLLNGREVVRIAKHATAARALEREACVLWRIARRLPVRVPVPTFIACDGPENASLSVHEFVAGEPLTRERWLGFDEPVRGRLAATLGDALRALHALDTEIGHACGLETIDQRGRIAGLAERIRGATGESGAARERGGPGASAHAPTPAAAGATLPAPLATALERAFRRYLSNDVAWSYRPAILHADVSPEHVLVDATRAELTGLIDWGDVVIGDPARDFIFLYEDWGADFLGQVLGGYGVDDATRFLPRVLLLYLADQLDWTLAAHDAGRMRDFDHGVAALERAVLDVDATFL